MSGRGQNQQTQEGRGPTPAFLSFPLVAPTYLLSSTLPQWRQPIGLRSKNAGSGITPRVSPCCPKNNGGRFCHSLSGISQNRSGVGRSHRSSRCAIMPDSFVQPHSMRCNPFSDWRNLPLKRVSATELHQKSRTAGRRFTTQSSSSTMRSCSSTPLI